MSKWHNSLVPVVKPRVCSLTHSESPLPPWVALITHQAASPLHPEDRQLCLSTATHPEYPSQRHQLFLLLGPPSVPYAAAGNVIAVVTFPHAGWHFPLEEATHFTVLCIYCYFGSWATMEVNLS